MTPAKVHCFFEQSGTFKNELEKQGMVKVDYAAKSVRKYRAIMRETLSTTSY